MNAPESPNNGGALAIRRSLWQSLLRRLPRPVMRTSAELIEVVHDADEAGVIDPDTVAMVEGALLVAESKVRDVMIPRSQMVSLVEDQTREALLNSVTESGFSRFPLLDDKRERVLGIVLAKDLLAALCTDEGVPDLRDMARPAQFVPESKRLNVLLREFRNSRNHLAVVVDEYGGISGLVTIEDVLEQIVGDIDDEHDFDDEAAIKAHRRGRWTVKGFATLNEFNQSFGTRLESSDYDTIGGYLLGHFGRVPKRGESMQVAGFEVTVLRADRRRIHLLKVARLRARSGEEAPAGGESPAHDGA